MESRENKKELYFERISTKGNESDFTTHFNAVEEIKKGNRPQYLCEKHYGNSAIEIINEDFSKEELIASILDDLASEDAAVLRFYGAVWEVSRKDSQTEKIYIFNTSFENEEFISRQKEVVEEIMKNINEDEVFLLFGGLYRLSDDRIGMYK